MPHKRGRGAQRKLRESAPRQRATRDVRAQELIRRGIDCLQQSQIVAAQRKFRQALGVNETSMDARGYLALTHVLQGNWEQAAAEAADVLAVDPDNLLALTTFARAQTGAGRSVEAGNTAAKALQRLYGRDRGQTRSALELMHVAYMLVAMESDRRLHQLYQRCVRGRPGVWDETLLAYLGIAAFNCGHHRDARWVWRRAQRHAAERAELFASYLFVNELVERERVPHFELDYRLDVETDSHELGETPAFLKVFALRTIWHSDDVQAQQAALDLLCHGDEDWETSLLLSLVREAELSDEVKMYAGTMLMERGLVPEDEPLEMHVDGALQPVVIRTERGQIDLDAEAAAFFGEALEADAQGLEAAAEAGYRAVLNLMPTFVPAMLGLATICRHSGRLDEAEQLLVDAMRAEPLDPLVLFNIAALRIQQGQFRGAWSMLRAISVAELPPDVRALYYWMFGRLALHFDMPEAAESAFNHGLQLDPDNEELAEGLAIARTSADAHRQRNAQSSRRRRQRHENQPIARNVSWFQALQRLTLQRLRAIGRHIGIGGAWDLRKGDLADRIASVLREELGAVWHALSPREQAALRWMDAQGGVVEYDELRRRFGTDAEDSIDWLDTEPETVPMRLQFNGLVFVGRLSEDTGSVAILPQETRHALRFAWRHG